MTIQQTTALLRKNELSCRELVKQYLGKIEKAGHLNAIMEINPDALAIADALDSSKEKNGALFGVPILLKDNISTADRMHTSAGSIALAENRAPMDAPIVQLLRKAGAVILGKTNMTEFANYMADDMANGYSSRGGQTLNVFDPKADPSGSSTGSAVAVAAELCGAAIGTETCGSIISPAHTAGITGIKPTAGLINGEAIIPISFTLDTSGPMTRSVEDAALLLGVLAGRNYEIGSKGKLEGVRIGICRGSPKEESDREEISANEKLIPLMQALGAKCVDLPDFKIETGFYLPIMRYEFKYALNRYLQSMANPEIPQTLAEIIAYNNKHADRALKYGQDILVAAQEKASGKMIEPEYLNAMKEREKAIYALDALFLENNIDILFMTKGDYRIAATTGFPSMTIPVGRNSKGLPIGSFMVARKFNEEMLMSAARSIELAMDAR